MLADPHGGLHVMASSAEEARLLELEQAKGVVAQRAGLRMDEAFQVMRAYARSHNRRLSDVAAQIIDGTLDDNQVREKPHPAP